MEKLVYLAFAAFAIILLVFSWYMDKRFDKEWLREKEILHSIRIEGFDFQGKSDEELTEYYNELFNGRLITTGERVDCYFWNLDKQCANQEDQIIQDNLLRLKKELDKRNLFTTNNM